MAVIIPPDMHTNRSTINQSGHHEIPAQYTQETSLPLTSFSTNNKTLTSLQRSNFFFFFSFSSLQINLSIYLSGKMKYELLLLLLLKKAKLSIYYSLLLINSDKFSYFVSGQSCVFDIVFLCDTIK